MATLRFPSPPPLPYGIADAGKLLAPLLRLLIQKIPSLILKELLHFIGHWLHLRDGRPVLDRARKLLFDEQSKLVYLE